MPNPGVSSPGVPSPVPTTARATTGPAGSPDPLAPLREQLGESTRLWGGPDPLHGVEPGYWHTISKVRAPDYNVIGVHAADRSLVSRAVDDADAAGVPALVMVAGPALGEAGALVEAGWTCVAADPFMAVEVAGMAGPSGALAGDRSPSGPSGPSGEVASGRFPSEAATPEPAVRRLGPESLEALRSLVTETFELPPVFGEIGVPDEVVLPPDAARHAGSQARYDAWGLLDGDDLRSAVLSATVDTSACLWSMATASAYQRQGYGRRLLAGTAGRLAEQGAERLLLLASSAGEPLYRSLGFVVQDFWQVWTKRG